MKRIKNIINTFLVTAVLLTVITACEDQLDQKVYTDFTEENFFKTEQDFFAAMVGIYSQFTPGWGNEDPGVDTWYPSVYNANNRTYLLRSMLTTDELYNDWDANLLNFTWGPSTWIGNDNTVYSKIRYVARVTDIINRISESDANENIKDLYQAEAKTLRAWLMYILYDFYGPVNVKLDPETLTDTDIIPRPSDDEYISTIRNDLLDAIGTEAFPDSYNEEPTNWGRVSKGVARMLLLKLYMHTKNWSSAELVARDIMKMGYALYSDYQSVFIDQANTEIIYSLPTNSNFPNWWPQHMFPAGYTSGKAGEKTIVRGSGWYGYSMPWEFFDKYDTNDLRLNTIISEYTDNNDELIGRDNGLRGAIPLKYTSIEGEGPEYIIDVVVFRYAEVLLSLAEAINEQRGPAEAYEYVNKVRNRAGLDNWSGMAQAQFRDAILDERGRELYCEGARRQDLIRHGKFIEYAQARGISDAEVHEVLFPIPQETITEGNGIIKQNDGY